MTEAHDDEAAWLTAVLTFLQYAFGFALGHVKDFFARLFGYSGGKSRKGYAPLMSDFDDFWQRRLFTQISDCWNRPINSCPGSWIRVMEREFYWDTKWQRKRLQLTGTERWALNLGSYNYLGFADPDSPCIPPVLDALHQYGAGTSSFRNTVGTTKLHRQLEELTARFVGKEAAIVVGMGFATNSTAIPCMVGKGGLIISDSLNHTSIVVGARYSGAKIKVFKHGDMKSLESTIRQSIIEGQPKSHRPWTKIVILVEGIYSMEGDMCPLPQIVALKKKYNCYLYVDEAHSIGALGPQGRGICNQLGVNPADIDVLMGTFTKSFGAVGGYVAGSRELIDYLKRCCAGSMYSNSISPPAVQQIISALTIILGEDGTDLGKRKIAQLKDNSNYFRKRLIEMGLHVIGQSDSPIVPVMIFHPTKIAAFSRECFKLGLATVVVGYPATPLLLSRARFCISAGHTREDLDFALEQIQKVAARVHLRYKHYLNG